MNPEQIAEQIASALGGKRVPDGYMVLCPCHADVNPSLHITISDETVFVFCHAGCDQGDVVRTLKGRGLWFPPEPERASPSSPKWTLVGEYEYRATDGTLIATKKRWHVLKNGQSSKKFGWYLADGTKGLNGTVAPLFGAHLLKDAPADRPVYLCYTPDTQVLTREGWVFFPDLRDDDAVAQYEQDSGQISFSRPLQRQRFAYDGELVRIRADWCDLAVTPDHRMLTRYGSHGPVVIPASRLGSARRLPVAGYFEGGGEGPTVAQVRLLAAYAADGHWDLASQYIRWNLKKERKRDRLKELLRSLEITWIERDYPSTPGWKEISIRKSDASWLGTLLHGKRWQWHALEWPRTVREALLDEIGHWDGDHCGYRGTRFFTGEQQSADVIAAIAAITGHGCIQRMDTRPSRPEQSPQWVVNIVKASWRQFAKKPTQESYSGDVFCCTVPTGFLVVRRNGKTCIAGNCEGEKCVLALRELGQLAVCAPHGAKEKGQYHGWIPEHAPLLAGRRVRLLPDNDVPGKAHMEAAAGSLKEVASEVKLVHLPGLGAKEDVVDWLKKGQNDVGLLATLCEQAPEWGWGNRPRLLTLPSMADVEPEEVTFLWYPYLPFAKLALLDGMPDRGKSMLVCLITAALSRGWPLPGQPREGLRGGRTLFLAAEDGYGDTVRPRLEGLGADLLRIRPVLGLLIGNDEQPLSLNADGVMALEDEISAYRPSLVVIDPLVNYMAGTADINKADEVRLVLRPLVHIAKTYGTTIIGLRHLNKAYGTPGEARGQGSMDFRAIARSVLVVEKDRDDPSRCLLSHSKSNLSEKGPTLAYRIGAGAQGMEFVWEGTVDISASDLFAPVTEEEDSGALSAAKDFLKETLFEGPVPGREVQRAAREAGVTERTLWRAKQRLRVKAKKQGTIWVWEMPLADMADMADLKSGQEISQNGKSAKSAKSAITASQVTWDDEDDEEKEPPF